MRIKYLYINPTMRNIFWSWKVSVANFGAFANEEELGIGEIR
jgi:hypothetical protein